MVTEAWKEMGKWVRCKRKLGDDCPRQGQGNKGGQRQKWRSRRKRAWKSTLRMQEQSSYPLHLSGISVVTMLARFQIRLWNVAVLVLGAQEGEGSWVQVLQGEAGGVRPGAALFGMACADTIPCSASSTRTCAVTTQPFAFAWVFRLCLRSGNYSSTGCELSSFAY